MTTPKTEIRRVGVEKILDLRHRILRAGLPPESACFDGDEADTTLHFATFVLDGRDAALRRPRSPRRGDPASTQPAACLTLMLNSFNNEPAWQLRGMAVDAPYQRAGLGCQLIAHAEQAIAAEGKVALLWCNARVPAAGFYQKHGWTVVSEIFEIPAAGPHVRMTKRLKYANRRESVEKSSAHR